MDTSLASGMYYLPYALSVNLAFLGELLKSPRLLFAKPAKCSA